MLADRPGLSQTNLARVIGLERATVGFRWRAIALGFVSRDAMPGKRRRYALNLTSRGTTMLRKLRERIPRHERFAGARLSLGERKQLRALLRKLVYG